MWQEFTTALSESERVLGTAGQLSPDRETFIGTVKAENEALKKKYAELENLGPNVSLAELQEKIGYARQMKMLVTRAHHQIRSIENLQDST